MKGLKVNFTPDGTEISLTEVVQDADCEMQNALINMASLSGGDPLYPGRGTSLLKNAVRGALIDNNAANHASNFAAIATKQFLAAVDYADSLNPVKKVVLQPAAFSGGRLQLTLQLTFADGTTSGMLATV